MFREGRERERKSNTDFVDTVKQAYQIRGLRLAILPLSNFYRLSLYVLKALQETKASPTNRQSPADRGGPAIYGLAKKATTDPRCVWSSP